MVLERLERAEGFTPTERTIASYILSQGHRARSLTISELAEETFASPATITRLCHKVGVNGYREFRIALATDLEVARHRQVDVNLPFSAGDSLQQVAFNMADLTYGAISEVLRALDFERMEDIVARLRAATTVNVFGEGMSATVALDFKDKLVRLGKQINVEENSSLLPGYAFMSGQDAFNIVITHSGETPGILECARILRSMGGYILVITAYRGSAAALLGDDVIVTCEKEGAAASNKIEAFASFNAVHFILDCLYGWLFQADYRANVERGVRNMRRIMSVRQ